MRIQMRHLALFSCICLCFIMFDRVSVARSYQDFQTWNLPDGAIARFGKGGISQGDRVIAFSSDGGLLAVATTIGVWLYDVKTTRELAFFTGESRWIHAVAFSPRRDKTCREYRESGDTMGSCNQHTRSYS